MRTCDNPAESDGGRTGEEMVSVYPPNSPFKVYSEDAYRQEMY